MGRRLTWLLMQGALVLLPARAHCQARPRPSPIRFWESDSIALDRLRGGWDYKTYRIVITKLGGVFVSPDSLAQRLFPVKQVQPGEFRNITGLLLMAGFERLPDTVAADPVFGQHCATDNPTMIVTVYHPQLTKRVVDDQGCFYAPWVLRELERMILETAGLRRPGDY